MRYSDRIELLRTKHSKIINEQLICNIVCKQLTKEYYERAGEPYEGLTDSCMKTGSNEKRENKYFNSVGFRKNWPGITIFIDRYICKEDLDTYGGKFNIALVSEPECIVPDTCARVDENIENIDLILTNKDYFLKHYPEKTVWIPTAVPTIAKKYCGVGSKSEICSHIISSKTIGPGHKLRRKIAEDRIRGIDMNMTLHGSGVNFAHADGVHENGWRDEKGEFLQKYLFSIAIENEKQENYYTEKILDCFATGTIPIYWGGDITRRHFNEKGIIYFDSYEELQAIKDKIYEDPVREYNKRIEYICENKRIVETYERLDDIILLEIIEFLSRKHKNFDLTKMILSSF